MSERFSELPLEIALSGEAVFTICDSSDILYYQGTDPMMVHNLREKILAMPVGEFEMKAMINMFATINGEIIWASRIITSMFNATGEIQEAVKEIEPSGWDRGPAVVENWVKLRGSIIWN